MFMKLWLWPFFPGFTPSFPLFLHVSFPLSPSDSSLTGNATRTLCCSLNGSASYTWEFASEAYYEDKDRIPEFSHEDQGSWKYLRNPSREEDRCWNPAVGLHVMDCPGGRGHWLRLPGSVLRFSCFFSTPFTAVLRPRETAEPGEILK